MGLSGNGIAAQISMQGTYQGRDAKVFHIMGQREDWINTTAFQDIAEFLDPPSGFVFPELVGNEALELVSSSASDGVGGVGTRTVELVYLDTSYDMQSVIFTLNGLTPVPVMGYNVLHPLWLEARSGGTSEVSVGNISLSVQGTGVVHERITAGGNRSLSARFVVPAGYEALIPSWDTHAIRHPMDCRLRATIRSYNRALCTRYIFQDLASLGADQNGEHALPFLKFPARCKIKASAVPGAISSGPRLDVSFTVILIKGD